MNITEARALLHELQDEYQRKCAECPEDARRYDLTTECLDDIDNVGKLKLIWAAGALDTAFEAAYEEVCEALSDPRRDYAY